MDFLLNEQGLLFCYFIMHFSDILKILSDLESHGSGTRNELKNMHMTLKWSEYDFEMNLYNYEYIWLTKNNIPVWEIAESQIETYLFNYIWKPDFSNSSESNEFL